MLGFGLPSARDGPVYAVTVYVTDVHLPVTSGKYCLLGVSLCLWDQDFLCGYWQVGEGT